MKIKVDEVLIAAKRRANVVSNALQRAGLSMEELRDISLEDILKIRGIGAESLMIIATIKELMEREVK